MKVQTEKENRNTRIQIIQTRNKNAKKIKGAGSIAIVLLILLYECDYARMSTHFNFIFVNASSLPLGGESTNFPTTNGLSIMNSILRKSARRNVSVRRRKRRNKLPGKNTFDLNSKRNRHKSIANCRSKLTFTRPTQQSIWEEMYGGDGDDGEGIQRLEFNHDCVGITNPVLHISSQSLHQKRVNDEDSKSSSCRNISTVTTASASEFFPKETDYWWPSPPFFSPFSRETKIGKNRARREWKVLTYRRRVGIGKECYGRVCNAALDWEFCTRHHQDGAKRENNGSSSKEGCIGDMGIIRAAPSSERHVQIFQSKRKNKKRQNNSVQHFNEVNMASSEAAATAKIRKQSPYDPLPNETNRKVMQIFSFPGGRKLATYTRALHLRIPLVQSIFGGAPCIYVINPVAVVYDLIDQRGGDGCIYTSTAYATLKGHWLSGEERVSVVMRDHGDDFDNSASSSSSMGNNIIPSVSANNKETSGTIKSKSGKESGGYVDVEILSYSRMATSLMGRLVWPIVGKMQEQFFLNQLDFLEKAAENVSGAGNDYSEEGSTDNYCVDTTIRNM